MGTAPPRMASFLLKRLGEDTANVRYWEQAAATRFERTVGARRDSVVRYADDGAGGSQSTVITAGHGAI